MTSSTELTALSLIDSHARTNPDHPAVVFEDRTITRGELFQRSVRLARYFASLGLARGGRVCVHAENHPDLYAIYFATLRCGAALFPINSELAQDEVAYILEKSDPNLFILDRARTARAAAFEDAPGSRCKTIAIGDLPFEEMSASLDPVHGVLPERGPDDLALVVHTSGTTARPKGVAATDTMEIRSAQALHRVWKITPEDRSVCALPLSYTFGMFSASYVALSAGASVLLLRKFNPVQVLEAIQTHRATYMVGVPTMYAMMLDHVQQTGRRYDLSSIRMMAASGAPAAPQLKSDFEAAFGVTLRDYYALSECTPIFSFDLGRTEPPPHGSVGSLVAGAEVRLVDDAGREVPNGETGELLVRSERLMPGYYLDPDRTAEAISDGWFKTRDLAWRDQAGHFFIVGRDRDQVISGGHKIASTEVESTIAQMPHVARVAVVGAPHPVMGELVKAVVVLKSGHQCSAESVVAFCSERLAAYKVPKIVEFRTDLPVSPAGKVLKRQLV